MGRYYAWANVKRREYIHPHRYGDNAKRFGEVTHDALWEALVGADGDWEAEDVRIVCDHGDSFEWENFPERGWVDVSAKYKPRDE